VNGRIACGSVVHFLSFAQKICTLCKFFVQKVGFFHPAGGESGWLSRQMPGLEPTA
jgi:hypothetical protein